MNPAFSLPQSSVIPWVRSRLLGTSRRKVGSRQRWPGVVRRSRDVDPGDSDLVAMAKQRRVVHRNARRNQPDLQRHFADDSGFGDGPPRVMASGV